MQVFYRMKDAVVDCFLGVVVEGDVAGRRQNFCLWGDDNQAACWWFTAQCAESSGAYLVRA